jgi:hypothetical protein
MDWRIAQDRRRKLIAIAVALAAICGTQISLSGRVGAQTASSCTVAVDPSSQSWANGYNQKLRIAGTTSAVMLTINLPAGHIITGGWSAFAATTGTGTVTLAISAAQLQADNGYLGGFTATATSSAQPTYSCTNQSTPSTTPPTTTAPTTVPTTTVPASNCAVTVDPSSQSWTGGYNQKIRLSGTTTAVVLTVTLPVGHTITGGWSAFAATSGAGTKVLTITAAQLQADNGYLGGYSVTGNDPARPTYTCGAAPVGLSIGNVSVTEGQVAVVDLRSATTLSADLPLQFTIGAGSARIDDRSTGRDVTIPASAVMKNGTNVLSVAVPTRDDDINELDETRTVTVSSAGDGVVLGSFTVTIVDNDRRVIVDVRTAGATGNGTTDDTVAIQRAVDQVTAAGGGVVTFPSGTYMVTSVVIGPGMTLIGQGGVLKRPASQGKWVRTLTTGTYNSSGLSAPLVIEGMKFDGNRQQQSEYLQYQLEQAHMLMLYAVDTSPGQLRAYVDRTTFRDGVADGVSVYTNVNVVITDSSAHDVFRGGLVVGGGNTDVIVDGFTTTGPELPTGIDFEIDGRGYGGSLNVRAKLSNLDIDADFDMGVGDSNGSSVVVDNLVMRKGPFTSYTPNAKVLIKNSVLRFGGPDAYNRGGSDVYNRLVFPYDMTIADSTIVVSPDPSGTFFAAVDVWFGLQGLAEQPPGVLKFANVTFSRGQGSGSPTYAVYRRVVRPVDQIVYENVIFDPALIKPIGP